MDVKELIEQIKQRNRRALGKAITIVEDGDPGKEELLNYAYKNMQDDAFIIGITGPGGAGKSTLIDKLIGAYRAKDKTVGVIAVDPSSPFTGGAVLGDRVRMGTHAMDKEVFIRSLGSRGAIGGISTGTKNVLYLYKTFGFDIIIVESLGVGQDETEITNFVDITVVTLVPGFGDEIQLSKAGIQEIGDVFIINKSDKPDADAVFNSSQTHSACCR
jgi:LAO/AO transport system kinase